MQPIMDRLPLSVRGRLLGQDIRQVTELRLRTNQPLELRTPNKTALVGEPLAPDELDEALRMLSDHSIYACEDRFRQGFFSLPGGYRVGLTGRYTIMNGAPLLTHVGSISIRVAREIPGAADSVMPCLMQDGRALSTLILSPPMLGKTTMLRDIARQLAGRGFHVAIADERGELASCHDGIPQLDVGQTTDVCDSLPKRLAIPLLVRAMSPEVIITDELGHAEDAEAVREAARSGIAVMASAHAGSYQSALGRRALLPLLEDGLFERVVLLQDAPGHVAQVLDGKGEPLWMPGQ